MALISIIVFLFVFIGTLVMFSMFGGASAGGEAEQIRERLLGKSKSSKKKKKKKGEDPDEPPTLIKSEVQQKSLGKVLKQLELAERIQSLIEQAGLRYTAAGVVQTALVIGLVAFNFFYYVMPSPLDNFALLAAAAGIAAPFLHIKRAAIKRMHKFEEQFPDSLEFVARSMRAGHAFSVSLEMIHREFSEPLAGEYRRTFDEQNLGLPLDLALQNFAKRVPLLEVQFFVSAVLLQKRTGGNLAELLDKLAFLIRERFKLRGRIRALSAHGKMTATALSCIPMAVAGLMFMTNPEYISFFIRDDVGHVMIGIAFILQLIGYAIMKKIVQIEV
jgi:tight adherence protein B